MRFSNTLRELIIGFLLASVLLVFTVSVSMSSTDKELYEAGIGQTGKSKSGNIVIRDKVPEVELSARLSEAERAIDYLVEEHNRRIDMLEKRAEYQNNVKTAERIKDSYTRLYNLANDCNRRMIGSLFNSEDVNEDQSKKWEEEIVPQILGKYEQLNSSYKADPQNSKWWGIYRESTSLDRVKALYNPTTDKIPNDMPQVPKTSKDWDKRYPDKPMSDYKLRMREYNKERWKVGYQLLMDIYHNHLFGVPPFEKRHMWEDQQTRYDKELYSPHYAYIKAHYIKCDIPADPVSGGYTDSKNKYDYYSHLPGGIFYNAHEAYGKTLDQIDVSSHQYDVCCNHVCDDGDCCHSYRSYCCTSGIHTTCPDSPCIGTHPQPPVPPRQLIWNGIKGQASLSESVYIDAPVINGEYANYYAIDSVSNKNSKNALKENTLHDYTAIPQPWKEPYNPTGSPEYIGKVYQAGNFTPVDLIGTGGQLDQIAEADGNGGVKFKKLSYKYFPMTQNRIQVFMDIYDDWSRAKDNYTKIVNYENRQLNDKFNEGLSRVRKRTLEEKFYTVEGEEPPVWKGNNISLGDDRALENLNKEITSRQEFYYKQARKIADEVSEAIISSKEKGKEGQDGATKVSVRIPLDNKGEDTLLYRLGKVYEILYYFGGDDWRGKGLNSSETSFYAKEESCNKLEHLKTSDHKFSELSHTKGQELSEVMNGSFAKQVGIDREERLKEGDVLCLQRLKIKDEAEMKAAATLNSFDSSTCLFKLRPDITQGYR